jgi:ketosteroid isomerase-like protein
VSQENVEIVKEAWRVLNRGDIDALLTFYTDYVDFRPPSHLVDGTVFHGHAGVRAWWDRVTEVWSELEGSPSPLAAGGEQVVMAIDMRLMGRESGVPVNQGFVNVYTLREGGRIAASIAFRSEREALEAAGLEG